MRLNFLFLIAFVIFFYFSSARAETSRFLFTDLRDVTRYSLEQQPLISKIFSYLQDCESCRPDQLNFTVAGPNKLTETRSNSLYGVELVSPILTEDGTVKFSLQAIGVNSTEQIFYYRGEFFLSADFKKEIKVDWKKYNLTNQGDFQITIARWERRLLLQSRNPNFFKVYPIGLGGFSLNYHDLQTPQLEGKIQKNHSRFYESREEPWYYYGFPFLGILDKFARYTMYGLHATLLPAAENFNRGFISTGCVHMQVKDVYEVYALIKWGAFQSVKVSIHNTLPAEYSSYDSPVPFNNSYHYRVVDGSKGEDGLTKMMRVDSPPPVDQLTKLQP